MIKLFQQLTLFFLACFFSAETLFAQTFEIDAPVIFYNGLRTANDDPTSLVISNNEVPYWQLGTEGTDASSGWGESTKVIADPANGTIVYRGSFNNLELVDRTTNNVLVDGIRATYEISITGVVFPSGGVTPGSDPLGSGANFIAIGDLPTSSGAGTVTFSHSDPAVFGGSGSTTLDLNLIPARIRSTSARWGYLVPNTITERQFLVFWGTLESGPDFSYFEPLFKFAAWYRSDQTFSVLGQQYFLRGDTHAGANLKPVRPIVECIEDIDASRAVAVFSYENQNTTSASIPVGLLADTTNIVTGTGVSANSGQPTSFLPGTQRGVFEVEFNKNDGVRWHLGYLHNDPLVATANSDTPQCSASQKPICDASPGSNGDTGYQATCSKPTTSIALDGGDSSTPFVGDLTYSWSTTCSGASISSTTAEAPSLDFSGLALESNQNCMVSLTVSDGIFSDTCSAPVQLADCDVACETTPILGSQFGIDDNANTLQKIARRQVAKRLTKFGKKRKARTTRKNSKGLYRLVWADIWSLPSDVLSCEASALCVQASNVVTISSVRDNTKGIVDLVFSGIRRLRRITGNENTGKRTLRRANEILESSELQLAVIPETMSTCQ